MHAVISDAPLPPWCDALLSATRGAREDADAAVRVAREFGRRLPLPGDEVDVRWSVLAAVASVDLTVARVLEAHADALAILAEAGQSASGDTAWGVFAAEATGRRLDAAVREDGATATLTGIKPWCSVAAQLDSALVTAHTPQGRRLFRVTLTDPGVRVEAPNGWVARGLRAVVSTSVKFDAVPAVAVGPPGWYLRRAGFAHGGLGVAACWFGGTAAVVETLRRHAISRQQELDQMHLGNADVALHAARCALVHAAGDVAEGRAVGDAAEVLALRTRSVVADAVERVLRSSAHALGPGPLVFDAEHASRVADLEVYVRQHHAERDLVSLAKRLSET